MLTTVCSHTLLYEKVRLNGTGVNLVVVVLLLLSRHCHQHLCYAVGIAAAFLLLLRTLLTQ